jgi:hypothetical protein
MVAERLRSLLSEQFDLFGVVGDGRAMAAGARDLQPDVARGGFAGLVTVAAIMAAAKGKVVAHRHVRGTAGPKPRNRPRLSKNAAQRRKSLKFGWLAVARPSARQGSADQPDSGLDRTIRQ